MKYTKEERAKIKYWKTHTKETLIKEILRQDKEAQSIAQEAQRLLVKSKDSESRLDNFMKMKVHDRNAAVTDYIKSVAEVNKALATCIGEGIDRPQI